MTDTLLKEYLKPLKHDTISVGSLLIFIRFINDVSSCFVYKLSFSSVGDEILGATINFEQLSKEQVLHVLKVMEPFNDKVHVFTRNNRSKSLGNLDQCVSPETVGGTDIYNITMLLNW